MSSTSTEGLQLGTSPEYSRMHTIIRRVCYVLLFGLVIEGALTFPLLAIWYGVPTLTPAQVCDELQKVMYSDESRTCKSHGLDSPPLGGPAEAQGQDTARDTWRVQPTPLYPRIGFRELVKNKREREARERSAGNNADTEPSKKPAK